MNFQLSVDQFGDALSIGHGVGGRVDSYGSKIQF